MSNESMTVEVVDDHGRVTHVSFAHNEQGCDRCQRYAATCISTPEERQRYRRSLRAQGWQTHTMHNYDVEWLVGLMAP